MLPAQREGGFQHCRGHRRAWSAGVKTGLQRGGGAIWARLKSTSHQASDGAETQAELAGDVRGSGPEPDHAIDGQP
jgi:hypothetical protein